MPLPLPHFQSDLWTRNWVTATFMFVFHNWFKNWNLFFLEIIFSELKKKLAETCSFSFLWFNTDLENSLSYYIIVC